MIIIRHAATSSLPFFPHLATYSSSFLNWNLCKTTIPRAHPQPPTAPRTTVCRHSVAERNWQTVAEGIQPHFRCCSVFFVCSNGVAPPAATPGKQRSALPQSRPLDIRIDGPGWAWVLHYSKLVLMLNGKVDPNYFLIHSLALGFPSIQWCGKIWNKFLILLRKFWNVY